MQLPPTIKKILHAARILIPFYLFYRMYSEPDKNKYNEKSEKKARVGIRGIFMILAIMAGMIPSILLPGAAVGFLLTIFTIAILPTIVDAIVKQCIRGISYLQNYNNTDVINKTCPQKYQPYDNNDKLTCNAMQALYRYKQDLKNEPKGAWGELSEDQQEQSELINKAVQVLRHQSIEELFNPKMKKWETEAMSHSISLYLPFFNSDIEKQRFKDDYYRKWQERSAEKTGIPLNKHDFLQRIISSPK